MKNNRNWVNRKLWTIKLLINQTKLTLMSNANLFIDIFSGSCIKIILPNKTRNVTISTYFLKNSHYNKLNKTKPNHHQIRNLKYSNTMKINSK